MANILDNDILVAENFLKAGNLHRAEEICQEVLQQRHDHLGAFLCLFDVHLEKNNYQAAYDLCHWRLTRRPECPDSYICQLIATALVSQDNHELDIARRSKGEALMVKIRTRLANYPLTLMRAEILYSYYFLDPKETLKLIKQARKEGQLNPAWLTSIEDHILINTHNLGLARTALQKRLELNPQNPIALQDYARINFFCGRLLSAIKYARQARRLNPKSARKNQEIIIAAMISLIPLFWAGHIMISLTQLIASKLAEESAMVVKFFGLIAIIIAYAEILTHFTNIETQYEDVFRVIIVSIGLWAGYLIFFFGGISDKLSQNDRLVKISPKY